MRTTRLFVCGDEWWLVLTVPVVDFVVACRVLLQIRVMAVGAVTASPLLCVTFPWRTVPLAFTARRVALIFARQGVSVEDEDYTRFIG